MTCVCHSCAQPIWVWWQWGDNGVRWLSCDIVNLVNSIVSCQLEVRLGRTGFFVSSCTDCKLTAVFVQIGEWFWHSGSDCASHQTFVRAEPNQQWFHFSCFPYTITYLLFSIYLTGFTTSKVNHPSRAFVLDSCRVFIIELKMGRSIGPAWS